MERYCGISLVQCDRKIEARGPDIVFIDKKERLL